LNLFHRTNRNGINTVPQYVYPVLPVYEALPVAGAKPQVKEVDSRVYKITHNTLENSLRSQDNGLEIMYSSPTYKPLATSFHASGGIYRTESYSTAISQSPITNTGTDPKDVVVGYFNPDKRLSYSSNARIGTATHLPRLKLVFEFTADFQLMNYSKYGEYNIIPIGYQTRDYTDYIITTFDPSNPIHQMLYDKKMQSLKENNGNNYFAANFHFSMAKEINKKLRLSFNVYNFLDYQPRSYVESLGTVRTPNSSPNFGAEISYKF